LPTIRIEIFTKTFTTAPQVVSPPVVSLCRELNPDQTPSWVPVRSEPDAIVNECFDNVLAKVARDQGAIVYGWLIWEWPRVFIEAEHHAVWEKNGALIDITPHVNGEPKVLFLPDPDRIYDHEGKQRIINVKRSLGVFASTDRWIAANDTLQRTMEAHSVGAEIRINRDRLKALWNAARNAQAAVLIDLASNTKVNDPCFCNSGKKYKKCCAPLIDLSHHS
jgi:hypothetical protein